MKRRLLCITTIIITGLTGCVKLPPTEAVLSVKALVSSDNYKQNIGIVMNEQNQIIYFGVGGKYLYKLDLNNPTKASLISTIAEATSGFNNKYGETFMQGMALAADGKIYVAAENKILAIDPKTGVYATIVEEGFSGSWGAYGITIDSKGNLFVGDHYGGIYFYNKSKNWEKSLVVKAEDTMGPLASFTGVELNEEEDSIYCLDASNSLLITCELSWSEGVPVLESVKKMELPIPFPEFLQLWNGDLFIKAARQNTMLRIRDDQVVQTISFKTDNGEVDGSFVTFLLKPVSENRAIFYGTTWQSNGTVYSGELYFGNEGQ